MSVQIETLYGTALYADSVQPGLCEDGAHVVCRIDAATLALDVYASGPGAGSDLPGDETDAVAPPALVRRKGLPITLFAESWPTAPSWTV